MFYKHWLLKDLNTGEYLRLEAYDLIQLVQLIRFQGLSVVILGDY